MVIGGKTDAHPLKSPPALKAAFRERAKLRQIGSYNPSAAENNLGEMYMQGAGVEQDYVEAFKWYLKAAQKGDDEAQNNLGVLYVGGFGVEQDFVAAMEWFQKSAKQGNVEAQANVGHLFHTGDSVARDYLLGYAWYGIAAAGGSEMGPQLRDSVLTFLNDDEVEQARAIARELYLKYARNRPNP